VLASTGFEWWQHKHCMAADVADSKKNLTYNQDSVKYITSYHFLPTVQETISNQNHISYQIRFKGRCFNMLAYTYIYTITGIFPHGQLYVAFSQTSSLDNTNVAVIEGY
jgi:hypothetical protein